MHMDSAIAAVFVFSIRPGVYSRHFHRKPNHLFAILERVMEIIIKRQFAHLMNEFKKVFEDHEDVRIWPDRRFAERRTTVQPVLFERRRKQRRSPKAALAEVIPQG